jgi:hypothetical protein
MDTGLPVWLMLWMEESRLGTQPSSSIRAQVISILGQLLKGRVLGDRDNVAMWMFVCSSLPLLRRIWNFYSGHVA